MGGGELLGRLRRHLDVALVGGDRLVLGAVVHEHPPDVGQAPDEGDVAEEHRQPQPPLEQVEGEAAGQQVAEAPGGQGRQHDEHGREEHDGEGQRAAHGALREALLRRHLLVGRPLQRPEPERHRLGQGGHAPDQGHLGPPLRPLRGVADLLTDTAITYDTGMRTDTPHVDAPRIMTPSMTACPPT